MLVPPVAPSATGDRPVGDTVARAQQTTGPAATTTLWPLAPAQPNQVPNQQSQAIPSLAATPAPAHNQGSHYVISIIIIIHGGVTIRPRLDRASRFRERETDREGGSRSTYRIFRRNILQLVPYSRIYCTPVR